MADLNDNELIDKLVYAVAHSDVAGQKMYKQMILDRMGGKGWVNCESCNVKVPHGQGFGVSGDDWPDKSKPRPVTIRPLCVKCMAKELCSG